MTARARLTLALVVGVPVLAGACSAPARSRAEILWDRYGVPHIFASDAEGLAYGFGWAQMQAHGDLILRLYAEARGRAAEYWGEDHADTDRWVRRMGVPSRAAEWYGSLDTAERALVDAFTAGLNDYAAANARRLADELRPVLPVAPADVLAHVQRVILFEFVAPQSSVDAAMEDWAPGGSNAWAIGPSRSASGRAMLVANPHLPWRGLFRWFEAHLAGGGVDAYGAALVGQPMLGIAFTSQLGWTHTVNTMDGADLFELTLADGGYTWDGAVRPFDIDEQILKIRRRDGSLHEETLTVRRSVHGPVVTERDGKALALRVVGLDQPHMAAQYWDMLRAQNLDEFEAALARLQNPFFTVMYADRDGRIMHLFGGRTPVRPDGDWNWSGIVPGSSAATLWSATFPYTRLPRVVDPPGGWLQNANDPPWTTTFPAVLDADAYPRYLAPRFMHFRAQRSARMLDENDRISFEALVTAKHSTRMELADRLLDDLLPAARAAGGLVADAGAVLERWDRAADAESRGAVLFDRFWREYTQQRAGKPLFRVRWNEREPRTTPDGFADAAEAIRALQAAALRLDLERRPLDVAWGRIHRLRQDDVDLPANGGPGDLGIFRVVNYRRDEDGRFAASGGDSYVGVVEFDDPVRAQVLLAPGNATQPGSPHRTDQLALFAAKRLRPAWRTRADIEANLERRESVEYR